MPPVESESYALSQGFLYSGVPGDRRRCLRHANTIPRNVFVVIVGSDDVEALTVEDMPVRCGQRG